MISQYYISYLNYCNSMYFGMTKSKINDPNHIVRIIVRMIFCLNENTIIVLKDV